MNKPLRKYSDLGTDLKVLRINSRLSMEDLSNTLSVDRSLISKFENGHERPTMDLLNRIISHFSLNYDQALKIWGEAGYTSGLTLSQRREGNHMDSSAILAPQPQAPTNMNISIDPVRTPLLYTDSAFVSSSDVGVTVDFAQSVGPTAQLVVQARVGMSRDQATRLIDALKQNLGIE